MNIPLSSTVASMNYHLNRLEAAKRQRAGRTISRAQLELTKRCATEGIVRQAHDTLPRQAVGMAPISSRMRVGVSGCCVILTPSASEIALMRAGGAQIAPPSPTPRKLTGLMGGVSRCSISIGGISIAVGTR